jgi:DNA-binding NtrC family response regulator
MTAPEKHTVLIVDDEHVIADTLVIIFANAGYDARAAYSAEQALDMLKDAGWQPRVAILDVGLPRMNGIDPAILLQGLCPGCGLSLFSGQAATVDLIEAAERKGHSFQVLAKPVHPDDLLSLAAQMLTSSAAAAPALPA